MSEYGNGLLKATENMIFFVKKEMEAIKNSNTPLNTYRRITAGGKILAYNKMLTKLVSAKKKLLERKSKEIETISDGFGNTWSIYCPSCKNKTMQIVRPGKVQCSNCG